MKFNDKKVATQYIFPLMGGGVYDSCSPFSIELKHFRDFLFTYLELVWRVARYEILKK